MKTLILLLALISISCARTVREFEFDLLDNTNSPGRTEPFEAQNREGVLIEVLGGSEIGDSGAGKYISDGDDWIKFEGDRGNKIAVVIPADGQSNQVGFGEIFNRGTTEQPLPNFFQLSGGDSRFYDAGEEGDIIPARLPLSLQVPNTNINADSVSIPWYVARNYARENPHVDVYVVSSAVGATGFHFGEWGVGDPLHENSIERVNSTLAILDEMYDNVSIPFWLWHQGEDDGVEARRASLQNGLPLAIQDRRNRVPRFADSPFVMGEISEIHESHAEVNAILREVADSSPLIGLADSSGLDSNGTNIHFTGEELQILSSRYISLIDSLADPFPVVDDSTSPLDALPFEALGSSVWNAGSELIFGLATPDIETGLIARYEFDDFTDSTGNQAEATSLVEPSLSNGIATFDGTNFLHTFIQQSGSFTRAARFRSNGTGQNNHNLVSSQKFPMLLNFTVNNGALIFGSVSAPRVLDERQDYNDNEWHTVVASYDHDTGKSIVFVDGFLTRSIREVIVNENTLLFLGSFTGGASTHNLIGDLDWARVYDRALSAREAQALSLLRQN